MAHAAPHLRLITPQTPNAAREDRRPDDNDVVDVEAGVAEHALPYLAEPLSFEAVFAAHGRYVASVVLRVLGRDHEVDDVVQEVFLTAMSGLQTIRNPAAVRGWL